MITKNPDRDRYFKRFWDCEPPRAEYDSCYDPVPEFECDYGDDEYGKDQDMVNKPEHYTTGEIECIDAMAACASEEEFRGHLKLTAFKHI